MAPILFVAFQLLVFVVAFVLEIRKNPSTTFKTLYVAAFCGIAGGLDVWYFGWHAYPGGFGL